MSKVRLNLEIQKKGSGQTTAHYTKEIDMDGQPLRDMSISEEDVVLQIISVQYSMPDSYYYCRLWEQEEVPGAWDFLVKHGWRKLPV